MIVMLIFLGLSIVLVMGTVIYLNHKKNVVNNAVKQTEHQEPKQEDSKETKKELSHILKVKIKDNIICVENNRYSNVIRLGNIDYNMLSNQEQDAIENILIQTALAIDYPVQFFSTTEYIDTSKVISLMKENKMNNLKVQEYKEFLMSYLQNLMENRSISVVKNYAIISYDGLYENAVEELARKTNAFKGNLLRAKVVCEILDEDQLYNLVYRELNKNSALNISNLKEGGKKLYVGKKQKKKTN